jgi:hypothetical protein
MPCQFANNFLNNVLARATRKIGIFGVVSCEKFLKNLPILQKLILIHHHPKHNIPLYFIVVCEE